MTDNELRPQINTTAADNCFNAAADWFMLNYWFCCLMEKRKKKCLNVTVQQNEYEAAPAHTFDCALAAVSQLASSLVQSFHSFYRSFHSVRKLWGNVRG